MKDYKYAIELFLKSDANTEKGELEFSKALEFPKKTLFQEPQFPALRYQENELEIANKHCDLLNKEIVKCTFNNVEFRIRKIVRLY